jgi:cell division protein FtsN
MAAAILPSAMGVRNMDRDDARRAARNRSLRAAMLAAALAVLSMTGHTGIVLAQNNPLPRPDPQAADPQPPNLQGRMEAPVGHRQPRPQDLPPAVLREEGERSPAQKELDEKLQICRGC